MPPLYHRQLRVDPSVGIKSMFTLLCLLFKIYSLSNIVSPFLEDPIDAEAALLRRELQRRRQIILRPRLGHLFFFSIHSYIYITRLHITTIGHRGLTPEQILFVVALWSIFVLPRRRGTYY